MGGREGGREWEGGRERGRGREGWRGEGEGEGRERAGVEGREGGREREREREGEGIITEIHTLSVQMIQCLPSLFSNQRVKNENLRRWRVCTILCWYLDKVVSHGDSGAVHQRPWLVVLQTGLPCHAHFPCKLQHSGELQTGRLHSVARSI